MKHVLIFSVLLLVAAFAGTAFADGLMNEYPNGNMVQDIVIQGDYAWAATYGSLVRWDKRDGSYIQFTTKNGLVSNNVTDLALSDDGKLWIATTQGVNVYDGQGFTTLTPENSGLMNSRVFSVAQSDEGVLWFGTEDGISKFDGNSWESYPLNVKIGDWLELGRVSEVVIDSNEVVWAIIWNYDNSSTITRQYLSSFDGTAWTIYNGPDGSLKALNVVDIAVDNNNILWAATYGNDLQGPVYTYDGTSWTDTGVENANDIDVADDGTVYLARGDYTSPTMTRKDDQVITAFDGSSYIDINTAELLGAPVSTNLNVFADEPGTFWFWASFGSRAYILYYYDGEQAHQRSTIGPLSYTANEMIVDTSNTKWLATAFGLSRFDGFQWENILFDVKSGEANPNNAPYNLGWANNIKDIAIDHDGIIWVATRLGVRKFDGAEWQLYNYYTTDHVEQLFEADHVVVDSNNVKWIINRRRLYRYDDESWSVLSIGEIEYNHIWSMEIDHDDVLWLGLFVDEDSELSRVVSFDGTNWTYYDEDNSPIKGNLVRIAIADDNTKWIATNEGYYSFDGSSWTSYEEIKKAKYPNLQPSDILIDNDGIVWICVSGYLHSFDGNVWDDHGGERYGHLHTQFVIDQTDEMWIVSSAGAGGSTTSVNKEAIRTVIEEIESVPSTLAINGNYPNPFNPRTTIDFSMNESGFTTIMIYNIMGQKVRTLESGYLNPGLHKTVWDGRDDFGKAVSSGVYICRLKTGEQVAAKQMMLMK